MTLDARLRQPRFAISAASARLDRDRARNYTLSHYCGSPQAVSRRGRNQRLPTKTCSIRLSFSKFFFKFLVGTAVRPYRHQSFGGGPSVPLSAALLATGWLGRATDCGWQPTKSQPPAQATAFLLVDPYASNGRKFGNITRCHERALRISMSQACQVSKLVSP